MYRQRLLYLPTLLIVCAAAIASSPVHAATIMSDWTNTASIQHEYIPDQQTDKCINGIWSIETDPGKIYLNPQESQPHEMCVYHQKDFVYAYYSRTLGAQPFNYTESGVAIAKSENIAEGILTPLTNFSQDIIYVPNSGDLLTYSRSSKYLGHNFFSYKMLPSI